MTRYQRAYHAFTAAILDRIAARDEQVANEALVRHRDSSRRRTTNFRTYAEQETPE